MWRGITEANGPTKSQKVGVILLGGIWSDLYFLNESRERVQQPPPAKIVKKNDMVQTFRMRLTSLEKQATKALVCGFFFIAGIMSAAKDMGIKTNYVRCCTTFTLLTERCQIVSSLAAGNKERERKKEILSQQKGPSLLGAWVCVCCPPPSFFFFSLTPL